MPTPTRYLILFGTLAFAAAPSSWAVGLANRPSPVDSGLLPKGLWLSGFDYSWSSTNSARFDNRGNSQDFTDYLSRNLQIKDFLKSIDDPLERQVAQAAFASYGLSTNDTGARVVNRSSAVYQTQTFVLGHGITKNLSFFVVAPQMSLNLKIDSQVEYSLPVQKMLQSLKQQGQLDKAKELERIQGEALAKQMRDNNYEDSYITSWSGLPQVIFMSRYKFESRRLERFTFETSLGIPTESNKYENQIIPLEMFEEAPTISQALYYSLNNFKFSGVEFKTTFVTQYKHRMPFYKTKRVPQDSASNFSADKEKLRIRYGDEYRLGAQQDLIFSPRYKAFANFNFIEKFSDDYSGSLYSPERYTLMEDETEKNLASLGAGAQINTIDDFLKQKFILPMIFTVSYTRSLAGQNTFNNEVYGVNAMVFIR